MTQTLNFSKDDKKQILSILSKYEKLETHTEYEEFRCKFGDSTVTLYTTGKLTIQGKDEERIKTELLYILKPKDELILGIDETGRGEKTGPLVIGFVLGYRNKLREVRDSKKTSDIKSKYNLVFRQSEAVLAISLKSGEIDSLREKGLNMNDIEAKIVNSGIRYFKSEGQKARILMDGSPLKGVSNTVEFLVKGDDKEPVIGAASIVAKHARNTSSDKGLRKTWKTKN